MQVRVEEKAAQGTGNSKQKAKHEASRNMLRLLGILESYGSSSPAAAGDGRCSRNGGGDPAAPSDQQVPGGGNPGTGAATAEPVVGEAAAAAAGDKGPSQAAAVVVSAAAAPTASSVTPVNLVGKLQELCQTRGIELPRYKLDCIGGVDHRKMFAMTVEIGPHSASGKGFSKAEAKRHAAALLLEKIESNLALLEDCPAENASGAAAAAAAAADGHQAAGPPDLADLARLREGKFPAILAAVKAKSAADFCAVLKDLGEEGKFGFTFRSLGPLTDEAGGDDEDVVCEEDQAQQLQQEDKERLCCVRLHLKTPLVVFGSGEDDEAARRSAAKNALLYLKLASKGGDSASAIA